MKNYFITFILICFLLGCAKAPDDSRSTITTTGDFSTPFQIQIDNFVHRQPPAVYIAPTYKADHRPKALFVPLRSNQSINLPVSFSDMLSRQVWQIWLSLGAFSILEYYPDAGPFNPRTSLAIAKQKGAELLVGGYINHYMDGGSNGESSVSLSIEIYDVNNGNQLWSMSQGGMMESRQVHDFYLFSIKERNPADPSGFIVRSLAWDMGREVLGWVDPMALKRGQKSIMDQIFGPKAF